MKKNLYRVCLTFALLFLVSDARATSVSFTGSLASSTDTFMVSFTLAAPSVVNVQTWGFGGGTNAMGALIAAGGFDPLIALFSGTGPGATILLSGVNPVFSADNFPGFGGLCPPGSFVTIGGIPNCGDATINLPGLAAGTYTLLLTDANYIPLAVNPGPPTASMISDGFFDLTGGVFQTCVVVDPLLPPVCITPSSKFAVDITSTAPVVVTPEPGTLALLGTGLVALASRRFRRKRPV